MCGLAGAYSEWLDTHELEAFRMLMTVASFRGRSGSGFAAVPRSIKEDIKIRRHTSAGSTYVYTKDFTEAVKTKTSILMGHCRWPTQGKGPGKDLCNLHPHMSKHIIGTHNGTFDIVGGRNITGDENDSAALFRSFASIGAASTLASSRGSCALAWIDAKEQKLRFYRNHKRPLFLGFPTELPGTIYWASEAEPLSWIIRRQHQSNCTLALLPANKIMSYDYASFMTNMDDAVACEMLPDPPPKDEEKKSPVTAQTGSSTGRTTSNLPANVIPIDPDRERFRTSVPTVGTKDVTISEPDDFGQFDWFRGMKIGFQELDKRLQTGCCWCGYTPTLAEHVVKRVFWHDKSTFTCQECIKDADILLAYNKAQDRLPL